MIEYKKLGATDAFMLLAVVLWAFNFSAVKIALREFTPFGFNGIRMVFASMILIVLLVLSGEGIAFPRADFWKILIMALSGNTFYQLVFIHGLNQTTASNTAIIIALTPVFIALLSTFFKHENLSWVAWVGIVISLLGFCLVVIHDPGNISLSDKSFQGDLLILLGNLFWAIYTVLSKPILKRYSPLKLTALTLGIGTIFYLPFCLEDVLGLSYGEISWRSWAALTFSGIFALVVCCVIWYSSVKRVGNSRTAVYDNFIPVFTVAFAVVLLKEDFTLMQALGTVLIFSGVWLTRTGYRFFRHRDHSPEKCL